MKSILIFISSASLLLSSLFTPTFGSDLAREKRLVEEFSSSIFDGNVIELEAEKLKFNAIFTRSEDSPKGVVVLLHGRGLHADWHNTIHPVRTILTEFGWDTLSLQMPVLHKEAVFEDYVDILHESPPRINSALKFVHELGYSKVVLLSHSCGGQMMLKWLKEQVNIADDVDALVNVSLGMDNYYKTYNEYPPLNRVSVPILDVYGELDIVKDLSMLRWNLIRQSGHPKSQQIEIPKADHMFVDKGAELSIQIARWLKRL